METGKNNGTVKVHKPDKPLRPIVSAVGAATYNISKFVAGHLWNTALFKYGIPMILITGT